MFTAAAKVLEAQRDLNFLFAINNANGQVKDVEQAQRRRQAVIERLFYGEEADPVAILEDSMASSLGEAMNLNSDDALSAIGIDRMDGDA